MAAICTLPSLWREILHLLYRTSKERQYFYLKKVFLLEPLPLVIGRETNDVRERKGIRKKSAGENAAKIYCYYYFSTSLLSVPEIHSRIARPTCVFAPHSISRPRLHPPGLLVRCERQVPVLHQHLPAVELYLAYLWLQEAAPPRVRVVPGGPDKGGGERSCNNSTKTCLNTRSAYISSFFSENNTFACQRKKNQMELTVLHF